MGLIFQTWITSYFLTSHVILVSMCAVLEELPEVLLAKEKHSSSWLESRCPLRGGLLKETGKVTHCMMCHLLMSWHTKKLLAKRLKQMQLLEDVAELTSWKLSLMECSCLPCYQLTRFYSLSHTNLSLNALRVWKFLLYVSQRIVVIDMICSE